MSRAFDLARRLLSPHRFVRELSVVAAGLVLLLGLLSVSPALHELCHADKDHHDADCDHHCVVTEFAAGEAWFTPPPLLTEPARMLVHVQASVPVCLIPELESHRLQPACGPPV